MMVYELLSSSHGESKIHTEPEICSAEPYAGNHVGTGLSFSCMILWQRTNEIALSLVVINDSTSSHCRV